MQIRRLHAVGAAACLAASCVFAPLAAIADDGPDNNHYSYQGSDYAYSYKSTPRMQAADNEGDGHWVYADYYLSGSTAKYQLENRSGVGTDVYRNVSAKPYKLRIVEAIAVFPNQYGDWDYPDDYTY